MLAEERQETIVRLLSEHGSVLLADLGTRFGVSEMTIRRDLDELEKRGLLRRVRGGAVDGRGRSYEPPLIVRSAANREAKERIARVAAQMVANGDSLAIDVGTTTLEVARNLLGQMSLTVVTPSLDVAGLLADQTNIRLIVTGGILRPGEHSLVGDLAESAFEHFRVDKLFLGLGGFDIVGGLTEFNLEDSSVKKAMIRTAKETILVADSSKFGRIAFGYIGPIDALDRIVTDTGLSSDAVSKLRDRNIDVVLA